LESADWLASRLTSVFGQPVSVSDLRRLTGGASRETWSFTAALQPPGESPAGSSGAVQRLVLRRGSSAAEAAALAAAAGRGVPVPSLVDSGDSYLITSFVDGETIGRRLLRDAEYADVRAGMAFTLGETLARIHSIPVASVPGLAADDPLDSLRRDLDAVGEPLPAVELALRWLSARRPGPVPAAIVHGDFRTGNLIISATGLQAVLDWELVHLGDPREDLGWLCVKCWRFGSPLPAGGFGTVGELLDGYESVTGWRPAEADVHWWQAYRTAWWAIGCRAMAERHLSGASPSVELAAIGRRVCEQEHDLLLALGHPAVAPDDRADTPSDLHGRPSAAELADAVALFLRSEVMTATTDRLNFLSRVAANAVDIVARELRYGSWLEERHRARLAALGVADTAALAAGIRDGVVSGPEASAAVRDMVTDRLFVANPRYFGLP
jgi:aminoglycoside phosphotransferase (APT) family kinase protein